MIVFDLDGTLSDHAHRLPLILGPECECPPWDKQHREKCPRKRWKKDWSAYHAACLEDAPRMPFLRLIAMWQQYGTRCEIWTCRPETYRPLTQQWFRRWAPWCNDIPMRMRPEGDMRASEAVKEEWLDAARLSGVKIDLAFEDRDKMVKWWRAQGVLCCQVCEGAY